MKSGKNQADRQRLKELYKNIVVHFQKIKNGFETCAPMTWNSFRDKRGDSEPLIKRMINNGDIIEINHKISIEAEEIEKEALFIGWSFYNLYKDIHEISIKTINKYAPIYHEVNGNNDCTKRAEKANGRTFTECKFGILLDKIRLDEKIAYVQNNPNYGINFIHMQDSRIVYSITVYPQDLEGISLKGLLYEINDAIILNVENANSLLEKRSEICKKLDAIIEKSKKRAKDPHTFLETISGAFIDMFKF